MDVVFDKSPCAPPCPIRDLNSMPTFIQVTTTRVQQNYSLIQGHIRATTLKRKGIFAG